MDARYVLPFVILAGCSSQPAAPPDDSYVQQNSYAKAFQVFETERRNYEKAVELHSDTVAEQKEKLEAARRAKDAAYVREYPPTEEEIEKSFDDTRREM